MSRTLRRFFKGICLSSLCLFLLAGAASPAGAARRKPAPKPPCRNALKHLGRNRSGRFLGSLGTAAKLKHAFADKKLQKDIQRAFDLAKLGPEAPGLIAAVAAMPDDAQPAEVPVGTKIDWMAYRKHHRVRVMTDACWIGSGPFKAWKVSFTGTDGGDLDFLVPVPCGNISQVKPPTCVLRTDKSGDTILLDLTGSTPGGMPIATYGGAVSKNGGAPEDLPPSPDGKFSYPVPCEPGAKCSYHFAMWAEDAVGFRSSAKECTADEKGNEMPPICKLQVTFDYAADVFHVDATGSGVAVQSITVNGAGPDGATVQTQMTGAQRTADIPYTPVKSGDWTFTSTVTGENGLSSTCTATVRACAKPTAKVAATYNCETRQMAIDVTGSSDHRVVTVTGPGGPETLSGNGPTYTYDVKRSGHYTVEVTADDGICPENTAHDSTAVDVAPFGDTARWSFRVFGAYVKASDDDFHETLHGGTPLEQRRQFQLGGSQSGFGAGIEYRPLHVCDLSRFGFALDVIDSELEEHLMVDDPRGWGMGHDTVSFRPVLLSLNYHFTPGRRADFFLGTSIGYAFLGDATVNTLGSKFTENYDDHLIYGLGLGVDVPFGAEHYYAFTAGVRQLFLRTEAHGASDFSVDVDPVIATAGISFRFR